MKLVYAAPVPYSSFAQRAHRFVGFCNQRMGGSTLWINPYPGRLPRFSDLRRKRPPTQPNADPAVEVHCPPSWLAEPMLSVPTLRRLAWRPTFRRVAAFVRGADWVLAIGRPSLLALELLRSTRPLASCYDAMDDFPQFHQGLAQRLNRQVEGQIARRVDRLLASSTVLQEKFRDCGLVAELVRNGVQAPQPGCAPRGKAGPTLGYIGTLGAWFDWPLVAHMARSLPQWRFELIGPEMSPPDASLPANVHRLGECASEAVFDRLQGFRAGLIPFKINDLTTAVDPIKYYEYRAAGLPVIATEFGEMRRRGTAQGVYLMDRNTDFAALLEAVAERSPDSKEALRKFGAENAWSARFAESAFIGALLGAGDGAVVSSNRA